MFARALISIQLLGAVVFVGACASTAPQRTTSLTVSDFEMMITDATLGLMQSDLIDERTPESPQMRITFDRITNLTTDLLTPSEQWLVVEQAIRSQEVSELRRDRNVSIIVPAARASGGSSLRGEGRVSVSGEPNAFTDRHPTHRLEATLRSATRIVDEDRAELYEIVFLLTELDSGEQLTVSSTLIKRAASGRLWD